MLERWRTGLPGPREPGVELLAPRLLVGLGERARALTPAGVGYAIIIGRGTTSIYVAGADRPSMTTMLRNDFLPGLRRDIQRAKEG